jgi:tRNA-dihydrouridine synthase
MKTLAMLAGTVALAVVAADTLAADTAGTARLNKLLADARAEAVELKADATDMDAFTKSNLSWGTYATQLTMIKEHVNNAGKILAQLQQAKSAGEPWQQTAIDRIAPLLKEMADNTEATIQHLNENQNRVHLPEFRDYVRANYEVAVQLEALITDFIDYGNAKQALEELGSKLELNKTSR